MLNKFQKAYLLVFTLLFFSGNPLATFLFGKFSAIAGLLITVLILNEEIKIERKFLKKYQWILLGILIIALFQYLTLPIISFLAIINLLIKVLLGGIIINYLKDYFTYFFFKTLVFLSLISLVFYLVVNIFTVSLPYISLGPEVKSYIIYGTSFEGHMSKNAGMFWEPGAHAGILTLCLGLNLKNLNFYWKHYRSQLIIIIATLLTTQSTTGYLVGFLVLLFYFYKPKNFSISLLILPFLIGIGLYLYKSTEFLKEKIESQYEKSTYQEVGDFSNTRFGSLIFDWHYIEKHPLIGNGFDERIRYQDHLYLFRGAKGDVIGSGNGFSHYFASMGVFFIIGYFVLLWRASLENGKQFALLIIFIVLLNLQGEQWFNFPLYLGLPFLIFVQKKKENIHFKYAVKS
jgi:hypothetical protein